MSMQRITISIPKYIYDDLQDKIPQRGVSRFAAEALEKELMKTNSHPIAEFINFRQKLPKKKKGDILKAIKKGRK